MTVSRLMTTGALTAVLIFSIGCKTTPSTKLTFKTTQWVTENCMECGGTVLLQVPMPGIPVWGDYVGPETLGPNPTGTLRSYQGTTAQDPNNPKSDAIYQPQNLLLPAEWNHWVREPSTCSSVSGSSAITYTYVGYGYTDFEVADSPTANNAVISWGCNMPLNVITTAVPSFAIAGSIPASITVPSQAPFSTSYGMPILYLYSGTNGTPSLAATVTASSVVSGGGSAVFPLPSSLAASSYGLVTANAMSDGSHFPNGVNFFAVGSSQSRAGAPFGVSVGGQTYTTITCVYVPIPYPGHGYYTQCTSGTTYNPVPVVSLYSAGQVLINGTPVSVGPSPTAVATYTSGAVITTTPNNNGYTTLIKSGATRAIVANSGATTISVLDIVNDTTLATIAVGSNPSALAVASDGSAAWVANYGSSTVTRIDLKTNTVTNTITVAGQPTSVTLTSAGILWVGGVGFLTEVNTQNMSVVATETTGKTIVALGYSNQVGQIVAVSVDSSGNVYDDQLNPANVTAGGTYTPLHSAVVSTLGTHMNTRTNANVRAFTSTLASTPVLNINQSGGPPLVVYDAWVAVTATPTGFTITDIADNYVFDSVSTPSPVTAIAVDPTLNVAYLTMPDSNLIWTVPLPGLGN